MNDPAQCPQCGRAVSEVDRAGGSCPWCGRVLTAMHGYAPKTPRHTTPAARHASRSSSSSSGGSTWSYWWVPLVVIAISRGAMSCNRMQRDSADERRQQFRFPEVQREPQFDFRQVLERLEQERRAAEEERRSSPEWSPVDEALRRQREALERARFELEDEEDSSLPILPLAETTARSPREVEATLPSRDDPPRPPVPPPDTSPSPAEE